MASPARRTGRRTVIIIRIAVSWRRAGRPPVGNRYGRARGPDARRARPGPASIRGGMRARRDARTMRASRRTAMATDTLIDISHFQSHVDFDLVRKAGIVAIIA